MCGSKTISFLKLIKDLMALVLDGRLFHKMCFINWYRASAELICFQYIHVFFFFLPESILSLLKGLKRPLGNHESDHT